MSAYPERIRRAQESLKEQGLGAAVFAPTDQMRYLTGWAEYGHERLIALFLPAEGEPVFVVPAMNAHQARGNSAGLPDVRGWDDADGWHGVVGPLLADWNVTGKGLAIDDELYSAHLIALQNLAPGTQCITAGDLMARLREIKTVDELAAMERSAGVTDAVYLDARSALREGITEIELQDVVGAAYKQRGTKPAFALVCFGANSAIPHHHTGDAKLKRGDVVIMDIGCQLEGYASDITRTVAFGRPEQEAFHVYDVVHRAHRAVFDVAKPGVACEDVDKAARDVITAAGYGEYFIHRTGHGIGLSTHEPPYIVAGNPQELRPGMCFSDEPGVYLPERFGVRIENIVTVTENGVRSLNADPAPELIVVGE